MSRASAELRRLNNYPEFKTRVGINEIMRFIQSNENNRAFPNRINTNRLRQRYIEKFGGSSDPCWVSFNEIEAEGTDVIYGDGDG